MKKINFAFFGSDKFSITVLEELVRAGLTPSVIISVPDKPKGRGLQLSSPPIVAWAKEKGIPILQPKKFKDGALASELSKYDLQVSVVASFGKIIPQEIIDLPQHGTLNVHPSLLPLWRGPSPLQAQILADINPVGVSIMQIDAEMDHGPVLGQKTITIPEVDGFIDWPTTPELGNMLAKRGGELLVEIIPKWISGELNGEEQDHDAATFCKFVKKEEGEITLNKNDRLNFLKYRAYNPWPGVYYFRNGKRVKITKARFSDGKFTVERVIPEGKKEMKYQSYVRE